MKAAIGAVLLNSTVRNAFLTGATRSANYILLDKARIWQSTQSPPDPAQGSVWPGALAIDKTQPDSRAGGIFGSGRASARYLKSQWGPPE